MRRHVILPLIALGGCAPDQSRDLTACLEAVKRFYPTYAASNMNDPGVRYIIGCMEAKGYHFSVAATDCSSKYPLPTQPACYTPQGSIAAAIDQFRRPPKSN
jgi:hypothetical protein